MCGICGIYNFGSDQSVNRKQIAKMAGRLIHRGPDAEGFYFNENFGMGIRRLSIMDLTGGQQPISNEDKTIHVVCNGEIYNHQELRKRLAAEGHIFKSRSDTEVIVHAYEEYGEKCVEHFNGMFAFAIWDERKRLLVVARDRIGIKPLYYYHDEKCFGFASELRALMAAGCIEARLDPRAIDSLFTYEYIPAPLTIFMNVQKLMPGHMLKVGPNSVQIKQYWELEVFSDDRKDEQEIENELLRKLKHSVSSQLMSDVPLGAFLSGGLDSSLIVALMAQESSAPIKTFAIGFPDSGYDELKYAKLVAQHLGTDHNEFIVNPNDLQLIKQAILALDEPLADDSIVPTLLVSRAAREQVKVVLSGDGGDELFAGYDSYRADRIACLYESIPAGARNKFIEPLLEKLPQTANRQGLVNSVKGLVAGMRKPNWLGHARWLTYLSADQKKELYHQDFWETLGDGADYSHLRAYLMSPNGSDRLSRQLYTDLKTYLVDDVLTKVDRMSMSVSLEVRPPFLDHELVEYVARIPSNLKLKGSRSKHILKQIAGPMLPSNIINRKKSGFAMPVKNWLRHELKPMLVDMLSDGALNQHGDLFNETYIRKLIDEHDSLRANHSHILWTLIVFQTWCDANLSSSKSTSPIQDSY